MTTSSEWHYHRRGGLQRYVCAILGHVNGATSLAGNICQGFNDPSGGKCQVHDLCYRCGAEASLGHPNWGKMSYKTLLATIRRRKAVEWWYSRTLCSAENMHPRKRKWFDHSPEEVPCDDCGVYEHPGRMWAYTGVEIRNPYMARSPIRNPLYCHNCAPRRQRARGSVFHDGDKERANAQPIINRRAAVMATRAKRAQETR